MSQDSIAQNQIIDMCLHSTDLDHELNFFTIILTVIDPYQLELHNTFVYNI